MSHLGSGFEHAAPARALSTQRQQVPHLLALRAQSSIPYHTDCAVQAASLCSHSASSCKQRSVCSAPSARKASSSLACCSASSTQLCISRNDFSTLPTVPRPSLPIPITSAIGDWQCRKRSEHTLSRPRLPHWSFIRGNRSLYTRAA